MPVVCHLTYQADLETATEAPIDDSEGGGQGLGLGNHVPLSPALTNLIFTSFNTHVRTYTHVRRFDWPSPLFLFVGEEEIASSLMITTSSISKKSGQFLEAYF